MGQKLGGGCAPLGEGELDPHLTECARAEAHLHAKFYLDPSNCLATVHKRYRQTAQTTDRWHRVNRFTNGRPKSVWLITKVGIHEEEFHNNNNNKQAFQTRQITE